MWRTGAPKLNKWMQSGIAGMVSFTNKRKTGSSEPCRVLGTKGLQVACLSEGLRVDRDRRGSCCYAKRHPLHEFTPTAPSQADARSTK
jgi:hypothetical protein